ncbi:hypothetical protein J6590_030290 [Homalodisca vitripennis]|nr:hypothetical protein J6590_030290 [Homalodisca vitripennis]
MLADADSGLATCSDLPSCSEVLCPVRRAAPPTLRQHYYPEGGWGWLVVAVAVAVQILTHGLHMAVGVWMPETQKHFHTSQMATECSVKKDNNHMFGLQQPLLNRSTSTDINGLILTSTCYIKVSFGTVLTSLYQGYNRHKSGT